MTDARRRTVRRWLPLALLALAACTQLPEDGEPAADDGLQPDQVFLQGRIQLQEEGRLRATLQAERIEQFRRQSLVVLVDSVLSVSWDSLGLLESAIECDSLRFTRDRRDLYARGHVRVAGAGEDADRVRLARAADPVAELRRDPPLQLLTSALDYVNRTGRIQTDSAVVFITRQDTLHGVGFSSDQDLRNWEIRQPTGVTRRPVDRRRSP